MPDHENWFCHVVTFIGCKSSSWLITISMRYVDNKLFILGLRLAVTNYRNVYAKSKPHWISFNTAWSIESIFSLLRRSKSKTVFSQFWRTKAKKNNTTTTTTTLKEKRQVDGKSHLDWLLPKIFINMQSELNIFVTLLLNSNAKLERFKRKPQNEMNLFFPLSRCRSPSRTLSSVSVFSSSSLFTFLLMCHPHFYDSFNALDMDYWITLYSGFPLQVLFY